MRQQIDVLPDVVAAGHIAQHHRRDAGDEDPIQSHAAGGGLHRLEHRLEQALAIEQRLVTITTAVAIGHQDLVGEVVVFVDQQIELVGSLGDRRQGRAPGGKGVVGLHDDRHREPLGIALTEGADAIVKMLMQRRLDGGHLALGLDQGEVPAHDEILIAQRGRRATNGQAAEQGLELLGAVQVVVMLQHRQQQALAEAARAQKDQLQPRLLQGRNAVGAVLIPVTRLDQGAEIAQAVGEFHAFSRDAMQSVAMGSRRPWSP